MTAGGNGKVVETESRKYHFLKLKALAKNLMFPNSAFNSVRLKPGSSKDLTLTFVNPVRLSKMPILSFYTVWNIIKLTNGMMMKLLL
jgi:hypothetical protein